MGEIDLHVHTTASDGTCSPTEVVDLALDAGLKAIAITDHDNHMGCDEALEYGKKRGLEIVPGIEISTLYNHSALHILGYYIDTASSALNDMLDWIIEDRADRNRRICALMAADGLPVDYDELQARFGEVIGRPHFARVLVELGMASDIKDAFAKYVNKGCKYYLPRNFLTPQQSVELIIKAGGIPVIAHPFQYRLDDDGLRRLIRTCMDCGLKGMECRYSGYDAQKSVYLESLAAEYGLLTTGGSDFHGENKKHIHLGTGMAGELNVPYEFLQKLKEAK